jgi:hypothetical protein
MNEELTEERMQDVTHSCEILVDRLKPLMVSSPARQAYVVSRILDQLVRSYNKLRAAVSEEDVQHTAFAVRNIMELSVWAYYCIVSDANAGRFLQDAARDGMGLIVAFGKIKESIPADYIKYLDEAKLTGGDLARVAEIEEDDARFYPVAQAAAEIDPTHREFFGITNKLLSKFVHPTAMSVLVPFSPEVITGLTSKLLLASTQIIESTVRAIESKISELASS